MAAPLSIKLFEPVRIWMAVNAVVLGLLAAAATSILVISHGENERLVKLQTATLIGARSHDIERGDFRSFIEGAGRNSSDLYVEINASGKVFSSGTSQDRSACALVTIPTVGGAGGQDVTVKVCRPSNSPIGALCGVIAAYALVSSLVLLLVLRLERFSTQALMRFFGELGVQIDLKGGLVELLTKVQDILAALSNAQRREVDMAKAASYAETARQVAHDIRSPLAALKVAMGDFKGSSQAAHSLVRSSVKRIEAIADDLLARGKRPSPAQPHPLWPSIESAVNEARLRFRGYTHLDIRITGDKIAKTARATFEPDILERAFSNILNNAVEASVKSGRIDVELHGTDSHIVCTIRDQGRGISPDILGRLMERGATFNKTNGNGLGLYHARQALTSWGGRIDLSSEVGVGTTVAISLPLEPSYGADGADASDHILVDDDIWIREAWETAARRANKRLKSYARSGELEAELSGVPKNASIYLDLELGDEQGDEVATRLHALGYRNLYLASAHQDIAKERVKLFRGVVGKEPVFAL